MWGQGEGGSGGKANMSDPQEVNEALWRRKYESEPYPRIAPGVVHHGWGSTGEPSSSVRSAVFSEAMGSYFREGVKILDYGCGAGRYCNFISGHLREFTYWGIEPSGGGPFSIYQNVSSMSEEGIRLATEAYGKDPRVRFGFVGSELEEEAIRTADVVLIAGIFTHLPEDQLYSVCNKMLPVVDRGGSVVFSVFLADEYRAIGSGAYGFKDTYQICYYTREQLDTWAAKAGVKLVECMPWYITFTDSGEPILFDSIFRVTGAV